MPEEVSQRNIAAPTGASETGVVELAAFKLPPRQVRRRVRRGRVEERDDERLDPRPAHEAPHDEAEQGRDGTTLRKS